MIEFQFFSILFCHIKNDSGANGEDEENINGKNLLFPNLRLTFWFSMCGLFVRESLFEACKE